MSRHRSQVTHYRTIVQFAEKNVNLERNIQLTIIQAVDETFEMMGKKAKSQIYSYFREKFGLRKMEVPTKLETFSLALSNLFGSASRHFEFTIAKKICKKLDVDFEFETPFNLIDYVSKLKTLT